ncbi:putative phosphotransferase RNJ42_05060 [Nakaseomyces bracarensis]|uniref:putative phosphotransferase n=1 Tax=Nakaseomyces bracarensis TaxID=273131 RepID=UPI0038720982
MSFYVGVDVGSGSARACIVDQKGVIISMYEEAIDKEELKTGYVTQSSRQIWDAVCLCVRTVVQKSDVPRDRIMGIGFDATCSLVVLDANTYEEVAVGPNFENKEQNIIMWMDHRAVKETIDINNTDDKCLKYVGGNMSIEMEMPKIKWLKNNMTQERFENCMFLDLPDFLTWKATGVEKRSYCSAVCKQGFLPQGVENSKNGWSKEFLERIDLPELAKDNFLKLGGSDNEKSNFLSAGQCIGTVTDVFSKETLIGKNCAVGSGIIDAYAGWIGTVGASTRCQDSDTLGKSINESIGRLAAVAGTSTCHIALSKDPIFVNGVWGPYRDVMVPHYWCAEGGQSCTGALLAHVLTTHPSAQLLTKLANEKEVSKFTFLNSHINKMMQERKLDTPLMLTKDFFLYGDYHGNRSPIADPNMRATVIGQSMDTSIDDLAITYLAACEFIAQQTKHIIQTMVSSGHKISSIYMSGGQCRNDLLMMLMANCTGLPIIIPKYIDSAVVFGSAILGAMADASRHQNGTTTKDYVGDTLWSTMVKMTPEGSSVFPFDENNITRKLLQVKYKIFIDMAYRQREYRNMVDFALGLNGA